MVSQSEQKEKIIASKQIDVKRRRFLPKKSRLDVSG
jgi:hypothetical protein